MCLRKGHLHHVGEAGFRDQARRLAAQVHNLALELLEGSARRGVESFLGYEG